MLRRVCSATIPAKRAIVFVRFGGNWNLAVSLIRNEPAFSAAPLWVARDLGPGNEALRRIAPERSAYSYDTASGRLEPLD